MNNPEEIQHFIDILIKEELKAGWEHRLLIVTKNHIL